jgi:hypothetical protein
MSITDDTAPGWDAELQKLTADHPGIVARTCPAVRRTARATKRGGRRFGRAAMRGWARIRGAAGSLGALIVADVAAFQGLGLVGGLIAVSVSLVAAEWLAK